MDRPASGARPRSATSRARPASARPTAVQPALQTLHEPRSPQELISSLGSSPPPSAVAAALAGQTYPAEVCANVLVAIYGPGKEADLASALKALALPAYKTAGVLGTMHAAHTSVDVSAVLSALGAAPAELAAIVGEMPEAGNEELAEIVQGLRLAPADLGALLSWLPEPTTNRDLGEILGSMLEAGALTGDELADTLFNIVDVNTGELCSFEDTAAVVEGMRLPEPAYAGLALRLCANAEELAELARPAGPSPERLGALLDGACASNEERAAFLRSLPASPVDAGRALNATAALSNADAAEVMRLMALEVPAGVGACIAQLTACSPADCDEILAALALAPEATAAVKAAAQAATDGELAAAAKGIRLGR